MRKVDILLVLIIILWHDDIGYRSPLPSLIASIDERSPGSIPLMEECNVNDKDEVIPAMTRITLSPSLSDRDFFLRPR